jgi:hypothetical protein
MTTEYLRGEVLLLLDWAQHGGSCCRESDPVWCKLRDDAQTVAVEDLSWVLDRALAAAESWCWDALVADDATAFHSRCRYAASLYDFGICSGLLARRAVDSPPARAPYWRKGAEP